MYCGLSLGFHRKYAMFSDISYSFGSLVFLDVENVVRTVFITILFCIWNKLTHCAIGSIEQKVVAYSIRMIKLALCKVTTTEQFFFCRQPLWDEPGKSADATGKFDDESGKFDVDDDFSRLICDKIAGFRSSRILPLWATGWWMSCGVECDLILRLNRKRTPKSGQNHIKPNTIQILN